MRALPDNAFDLAIADPMYGIGENGTKARSRCNLATGPKYPIIDDTPPGKSYFDELFRISKNQIIWGANHFIEAFARNSACWIVWDKVNGNNNYADCELAWTSFPGSVRKITFMWSGMMQGKSIEEGQLRQCVVIVVRDLRGRDVMSRKEITAELSRRLERYIDPNCDTRIYWAKEITFDYSTEHSVRVDYMKFTPVNNSVSGIEKGDFYCYEIKSSIEDFHSKNGHNFIGDYNYYVMPQSVFDKVATEIPYDVGVLVPDECRTPFPNLYCLIPPRRRNRNRPCSEMLLMMFRSSRREAVNTRRDTLEAEMFREWGTEE